MQYLGHLEGSDAGGSSSGIPKKTARRTLKPEKSKEKKDEGPEETVDLEKENAE